MKLGFAKRGRFMRGRLVERVAGDGRCRLGHLRGGCRRCDRGCCRHRSIGEVFLRSESAQASCAHLHARRHELLHCDLRIR